MKGIEKERTMKRFIEMSRKFTAETGLGTRQILRAMEKIPEASMSMLGETIFVPTNRPRKALAELKKICKRTTVARIATKGAGRL